MSSPWIDHIRSLMEPELLETRLAFNATPLVGLEKLEPELAAMQLHERLSQHYVPNAQSIDLAKKILSTALARAMRAYPDVATFVNHSNMAAVPLDEDPPTWVITGLAGVGKSALFARLERLFDNPSVIQASEHCLPKPIFGGVFLKLTGKVTKAEIYRSIATRLGIEMGEADKTGSAILMAIRNELYRQGCMFILADESQSLGSSKNAGAVFVNFIALLRKFGLPVIVVGNYSMVHGIFKQPSQHRQRILNDPSVMMPDDVGDVHLKAQLQAYKDLCSEFVFDPDADGPRIHFLSGGCSRALLKLLALAYRNQRSVKGPTKVTLEALEEAYESTGFVMHRQEIALLREHRKTGKHIREDLMNPFDLAGPVSAQEKLQRAKFHREKIAAAVARTVEVPHSVHPINEYAIPEPPANLARSANDKKCDVASPPLSLKKTRARRPPPSVDDAMRGWS